MVQQPRQDQLPRVDGSVFIALTNNTGHGNVHGQIVRMEEAGGDPSATTFSWSIFAVGGPQSGLSSPNNLLFASNGNLWMVTDISSSRVGSEGTYGAVVEQFAERWVREFQANQTEAVPAAWVAAYLMAVDSRPVARAALTDFYTWAVREQLLDDSPVPT